MYQNYNYYPQQTKPMNYSYLPTTSLPAGLKGRPVSSIDEVKASTIDFDGSIFYFPDLANRRIYTKQINMDGTATVNVYELTELPVAAPAPVNNFVTREEFEQVVAQLKAAMTPATIVQPTAPPQTKLQVKEF